MLRTRTCSVWKAVCALGLLSQAQGLIRPRGFDDVEIVGRGAKALDPNRTTRTLAKQKTEDQIILFCNVTGPCRPCNPEVLSQPKTSSSEAHSCRHFSHVQNMECEVDVASAQHIADALIDPLPSMAKRQQQSRVEYQAGCLAKDKYVSVFWVEFGAFAVLCIALPTVIWQKHLANAARDSF